MAGGRLLPIGGRCPCHFATDQASSVTLSTPFTGRPAVTCKVSEQPARKPCGKNRGLFVFIVWGLGVTRRFQKLQRWVRSQHRHYKKEPCMQISLIKENASLYPDLMPRQPQQNSIHCNNPDCPINFHLPLRPRDRKLGRSIHYPGFNDIKETYSNDDKDEF